METARLPSQRLRHLFRALRSNLSESGSMVSLSQLSGFTPHPVTWAGGPHRIDAASASQRMTVLGSGSV